MSRALWMVAIATGAFLRVWRLAWGLPDQPGFPDEVFLFTPYATRFVPLSLQSFDAPLLLYPTLHGYLVGLAAAAADFIGVLEGTPQATSPEAILLARGVSATMGVATVIMTGVLGARMYGRDAGLAAAALMAVVPLHALYGHLATTDTTLVAVTTAGLIAAHAAARSDRTAPVIAAGALAGMAAATKYSGLACVVAVAWALLERTRRTRSVRAVAWAGAAAACTIAITFSLACPPCVLHPDRMLAGMSRLYEVTSAGSGAFLNNAVAPTLGWYGRPYLYQLVAGFPFTLGLPLYAAAGVGLLLAARRRTLADRLLLVTLVTYFATIASSRVAYTRYLLPMVPGLTVLAARVLGSPGRWRQARIAACVLVWTYTLALTASQTRRFSYDQQAAVASWVACAVGATPQPARVAVPRSWFSTLDYYRLSGPLRRAGLEYTEVPEGGWFRDQPEAIVIPEWYAIALARDLPGSRAAADLVRLRSGEARYLEAASWKSTFLTASLYTALDPAFAGALWQGEIGFAAYLRSDLARPGAMPACQPDVDDGGGS